MTDGLGGAALVAVVALVPLVALMLTSFVKVSIVLALLRNAIGSPDAPSGLVVMGISLVLTFFVMAPVAIDMVRAAAPTDVVPGGPGGANVPPAPPMGAGAAPMGAGAAPMGAGAAPTGAAPTGAAPTGAGAAPTGTAPMGTTPTGTAPTGAPTGTPTSAGSAAPTGTAPTGAGSSAPTGATPTDTAAPTSSGLVVLDLEGTLRAMVPAEHASTIDAGMRALGPLRDFLVRHASPTDRDTFVSLAERMGRSVTGDELWILAPAFLTTELREAFAIAVLLFIPFLVLDLVVALGLSALGLASTQPGTVALPLKLLLFVAVDGWRLLVDSLLRGYL